MNYNLDDGHSLLERLVILHHFMNVTKQALTKDDIENAKLLSNLITFIDLKLSSHYDFTYGTHLTNIAFKHDGAIEIKKVHPNVTDILHQQLTKYLTKHKLQSADQIVHAHNQISNDDLILLTMYPTCYFQWKNRHVKIISPDLVYDELTKYFSKAIITQLINKPTHSTYY